MSTRSVVSCATLCLFLVSIPATSQSQIATVNAETNRGDRKLTEHQQVKNIDSPVKSDALGNFAVGAAAGAVAGAAISAAGGVASSLAQKVIGGGVQKVVEKSIEKAVERTHQPVEKSSKTGPVEKVRPETSRIGTGGKHK